jgi:hypothetical protein
LKFFRPAAKDDFKGYDVQFDHGRFLSNNVKKLIEDGEFNKARLIFRNETGIGLSQSKPYCEEYQRYVNAKKDFNAGKPVFISY